MAGEREKPGDGPREGEPGHAFPRSECYEPAAS